jgi:hypothetical protein
MIPVTTLIAFFVCHFVADFILQCDRVAINKSKSFVVLSEHCLLYSIPFMIFGWQFALINAGLHFVVDAVTSRTTAYLWQREERH